MHSKESQGLAGKLDPARDLRSDGVSKSHVSAQILVALHDSALDARISDNGKARCAFGVVLYVSCQVSGASFPTRRMVASVSS